MARKFVLTPIICAIGVLFLIFSYRSTRPLLDSITDADQSFPPCTELQGKDAVFTFLSAPIDLSVRQEFDIYFLYVRTLLWQFLHDPITKSRISPKISFVVMANPAVNTTYLKTLKVEGAFVCYLQPIAAPLSLHSGQTRWWDQFSKLQMWNFTQFERILYIDADTLLLRSLDELWSHSSATSTSGSSYLFSALSDSMSFDHQIPLPESSYFNAGFMLLKPSLGMYQELIDTMLTKQALWQAEMQEQDLLNYVFHRDRAMPWQSLDRKMNINHPTQSDIDWGVHSIHNQFHDLEGDAWSGNQVKYMSILWYQKLGEMQGFWLGKSEA